MEYSKTFDKFTFEEKASLLHSWFPDTTKALLDRIHQYIKEWLDKTEFLKRNWAAEDITADKWIELLLVLNCHLSDARLHIELYPHQFFEPFTKGFFHTFFLSRLKEFLDKDCTDKLFIAIAMPFFFPREIQ